MFCGVAVSCGPQTATVKKSLARNVFAAKQRQNCCQNISHDTLRAAFVVENQRERDSFFVVLLAPTETGVLPSTVSMYPDVSDLVLE